MPDGARFAFPPFALEPERRRLTASGEPVAISERQFDVLHLLVARAGQIVPKEDLLQAGWKDVAVGDNSIEQAVSSLRRLLGPHPSGAAYIDTVPRRGYRFGVPVSRETPRVGDAALDALLAPHRAFLEGRAALETLERNRIAGARTVFEAALASAPDYASAHIGLANACAMQFETTRTDLAPDTEALALAARHAREACRLAPQSAEAWATLGFVLERTGNPLDARAASRRAVALEPDNWRHHFRLAYVSWGEERLGAAHRTLALLPNFPLAHWLAATVYVARQVLDEAERELTTGLAAQAGVATGESRFGAVALHWLLGLIHLSRGDEARALSEFEQELSFEHSGQLYARECAANTWYAIGALRLRQGRRADAHTAFLEALARVATHPLARLGLRTADARAAESTTPSASAGGVSAPDLATASAAAGSEVGQRARQLSPGDAAVCRAVQLTLQGHRRDAAQTLEDVLAHAAPDNAAWVLPIEPLLHVSADLDTWARALALLRNRAA